MQSCTLHIGDHEGRVKCWCSVQTCELIAWTLQGKGKKADFIIHDDRSLLALQGPAAHETLQPLLKGLDLNTFYFSNFAILDIARIPCWLTRTG